MDVAVAEAAIVAVPAAKEDAVVIKGERVRTPSIPLGGGADERKFSVFPLKQFSVLTFNPTKSY